MIIVFIKKKKFKMFLFKMIININEKNKQFFNKKKKKFT